MTETPHAPGIVRNRELLICFGFFLLASLVLPMLVGKILRDPVLLRHLLLANAVFIGPAILLAMLGIQFVSKRYSWTAIVLCSLGVVGLALFNLGIKRALEGTV